MVTILTLRLLARGSISSCGEAPAALADPVTKVKAVDGTEDTC